MIGRYRVSLGGVQLDSIHDKLLILDVRYGPKKTERQKISAANLDGYALSGEFSSERSVTVIFELHIYDTAERNRVCQLVNAWAENGRTLKTSDREGQYLTVYCDQQAEIGSVRNWTDPLSLVFTTKWKPDWTSEKESVVTLNGKSASGTLKLDGNLGSALVSVSATAAEAVSSFQATVGDTTIYLTGLSVPAGQKIEISYIDDRYLRIRANGKSVRMKPESSDNLRAPCGANTKVSFTANKKMTVVFSARGVFR